jgi:hypothetical protein
MTKEMRDFKVLSQANMSAVGKDLENMANMQGACESTLKSRISFVINHL